MFLRDCKNVHLGRAYIRMNAIKFMSVTRHHHNEPGFQLWMMSSATTGSPTRYEKQSDALRDARLISETHGLNIEPEGYEPEGDDAAQDV